MSVTNLKNLIIIKTWRVPISKKELFNAILMQLNNLFPPITYKQWWFYQPAWNAFDHDNYMDFYLQLVYLYINGNIDRSKPLYEQYVRLKAEFHKNVNKMLKNAPSFVSNGDPQTLHIDILETSESGCVVEIECCPFLYFNITNFKAKIDSMGKQHALIMCERFLKTLAVGLNAKEIDRAQSDIAKFTTFLGIDKNWMSATYALQLQEVSITMVAKKKGISLKKEDVERILDCKITEGFGFDHQYKAFAKEVKRLYDIEIPSLARFLRKMRQAVLHEGYNPTNREKELIVSATIDLLKALENVYKVEKVTNSIIPDKNSK